MPRSRRIRFLASLLIALLLAACIGVAAWTGLLALHRSSAPERSLPPIAPLVAPPRPSRLPAAPEFARNAMPATARRDVSRTTIIVHLPPLHTALQAADAGVATCDARTGADFTWIPLADAATAPDGSRTIETTTRVRGDLDVSLANGREWARHGYLTRVRVPVGTTAANPVVVDLPATIDLVRLRLPEGCVRAGPMYLSRCDDPQWLPTMQGATGIEVVRSKPTFMLLGAGCYELVDPIDPTRRQRFDVPSNGPVELTSTLTAARADRP